MKEDKPKTTVTHTSKTVQDQDDVQQQQPTIANIAMITLTVCISIPVLLIVGHALPVLDSFFNGIKPLASVIGYGAGLTLIALLPLSVWYVHDRFRVDIKRRAIEARKFAVDQAGNHPAYFDTNKMFIVPKPGVTVQPVPQTYAPHIQIVNRGSNHKEIVASELPALASGKPPTLSDQLQSGETASNETTSIIGYIDGKAFRAKIFDDEGNLFNSCFIFGDQGYGKSTFATYLAALTILQGGKLIVIDPESKDPQALTVRLGPLVQEQFLLCPIADTPEKAEWAMKVARRQIEIIGNHPVLVLIDEFTLIARQTASGRGPWAEVGADILDVSEEYATRGRKKRCRVICLGQIPKAERSGGTEVRDSMATVCFNLKKERAQRVLETDEAAQAPSLKIGEIILAPSATTYRLQLPYPDEKGLEQVASMGISRKPFTEPVESFHDISRYSQDTDGLDDDFESLGTRESVVNEAMERCESIPQFSPDEERQIIEIARVQLIMDGKVTRAKIPMAMNPPHNNRFYPVVKHICDRERF